MVMMTWISSSIRQTLEEITVEPVLFLYMLSIFSQYTLFQDLVYSKVCWAKYDNEVCDNLHTPEHSKQLDFVQETSSHWILLATLCTAIPSLFVAIYLGSWSDRFGRKWPVAIPPLGGVFACIVYMVISFVPAAPVALICFASLLAGLSGGFISCVMSCMTYVSAVTTEKNRTTRISRLEAMTYLGGTIGPFISGSILPYTGHGYAFLLMLICYTAAFLYTVFFVPDMKSNSIEACEAPTEKLSNNSIPDKNKYGNNEEDNLNTRRHSQSPTKSLQDETDDETKKFLGETTPLNTKDDKSTCCTKYFSSEHFVGAVRTCCKQRDGNRRFIIIAVITAGFITMMITSGELDVAYLFAKDQPLVWTYQTYAYYLGYKFGLGAFALLFIMPIFQRLNFKDATMSVIGLISRAAGLVCFGLSTMTIIAFMAPVVSIFSFFTIPSIRALLSKLVLPSEQGKMFAFIAITEDLCSISASILFNTLYPLTRPLFHGCIFQMAACILIVPLLIMLYVKRNVTLEAVNSQGVSSVSSTSVSTAAHIQKSSSLPTT